MMKNIKQGIAIRIPQLFVMTYGKDSFFAFFLSTTIWFTPLRTVCIEIGNSFLTGIGILISRIMILCFIAYVAFPFRHFIKVKKIDIAVFLFVGVQWFRSLMFSMDFAGKYISIFFDFAFKCIPFYFVACNTVHWKSVKELLYKSATVCILLMAGLTLIKDIQGGGVFQETDTYSMFYGLLVGRGAVIKCIEFIHSRKLQTLPLIVISIVLMVVYGTRTPIVCTGLAVFLCMLALLADYSKKKKRTVKRSWLVLVAIFIIFLAVGTIFIVKAQSNIMTTIMPGERILYVIANGEFFQSEGRWEIYKAAIQIIGSHSLFGTGIVGDRVAIASALELPMDEFAGNYSHNLFIELVLQNGVIMGGFLIALIIYFCFYGLFRSVEMEKRIVYLYLISMGVGSLMLAGTAMGNPEFWIFLAMGFSDLKLYFRKSGHCGWKDNGA